MILNSLTSWIHIQFLTSYPHCHKEAHLETATVETIACLTKVIRVFVTGLVADVKCFNSCVCFLCFVHTNDIFSGPRVFLS